MDGYFHAYIRLGQVKYGLEGQGQGPAVARNWNNETS